MILNSASVIEEFTIKNSGICLYLSNSFCQDTSENGKKIPEIGCHSVIDSPDSVRRVMPPIIIRKIGSWIGSFKRTLSNIQNEVTEITDIDKENLNNKPKDLKEENKKDNV